MSTPKTKKRNPNNTPKTLTIIAMVLTLVYAIGIPIFDIREKLSATMGQNFLDAQHNTTTFETYLTYLAFLPLLLFASFWAYGTYTRIAWNKNGKLDIIALAAAGCVIGFSLLLYIAFGLYFGLMYHFVS